MTKKTVIKLLVLIVTFFAFYGSSLAIEVLPDNGGVYKNITATYKAKNYRNLDFTYEIQKRISVGQDNKTTVISYCFKGGEGFFADEYKCYNQVDLCKKAVGICEYDGSTRSVIPKEAYANHHDGTIMLVKPIDSGTMGYTSEPYKSTDFLTIVPTSIKVEEYQTFTCKYESETDASKTLRVEYNSDGTHSIFINEVNADASLSDVSKNAKDNASDLYFDGTVTNFSLGVCPKEATYYQGGTEQTGVYLANSVADMNTNSKFNWLSNLDYTTLTLSNRDESNDKAVGVLEKQYVVASKNYLSCMDSMMSKNNEKTAAQTTLQKQLKTHLKSCYQTSPISSACGNEIKTLSTQLAGYRDPASIAKPGTPSGSGVDNTVNNSCNDVRAAYNNTESEFMTLVQERGSDAYLAKYSQVKSFTGCGILGVLFKAELQKIFNGIKLLVVVALVVFGMLDFSKAAMSGEADSMKKATKKFTNRIIIAVLIFFLPILIDFIVSGFFGNNYETCIKNF